MDLTITAYVMLRVILGVLFLGQGFDKLFRVGIKEVSETFAPSLKMFPVPLVRFFSGLTSIIEFAGGILLIAGLFTNFALTVLAINMVLVAVGFTFIKPMWDMQYFFPRLIILTALLVLPQEWNTCSLDYLFR